MPEINIFSENIFEGWNLDEKLYLDGAREILKFYLNQPEVYEKSCLNRDDYDTISFDFVYCDGAKTHELNREYRDKDYPADIITFAIFADTDEDDRFIFDGEINLGEVLIALDKVIEESQKKQTSKEYELMFLISHGIMHLLGFDHQTEEEYNFVVGMQKKALESIGYDEV